MKPTHLGLAMVAGLLVGTLAWAAGMPAPDSYAKVDAASLVTSPQSAWARAILFTDVLVSPPAGKSQRLDRKNYLQMKLENAGTAWVPENLAPKFLMLKTGDTYSFAGTVDQISRRYYLIVDACFRIQTAEDMAEQWIDMLNPPQGTPESKAGTLSETAMQALLLEAQNSLIQMAKDNNTTVAQLIEAQTDGGQRIAEKIVADALQGELQAQNKTAEEVMISSVLALLQKQAVLEESSRVAAENAAAAAAPAVAPETPPEAAPAPAAAEPVPEPTPPPAEAAPAEAPAAAAPVEVQAEAVPAAPEVPAPEAAPAETPAEAASPNPEAPAIAEAPAAPEATVAETKVEPQQESAPAEPAVAPETAPAPEPMAEPPAPAPEPVAEPAQAMEIPPPP